MDKKIVSVIAVLLSLNLSAQNAGLGRSKEYSTRPRMEPVAPMESGRAPRYDQGRVDHRHEQDRRRQEREFYSPGAERFQSVWTYEKMAKIQVAVVRDMWEGKKSNFSETLDIISRYLISYYGFPLKETYEARNQIFAMFNQFGFVNYRGDLVMNQNGIRKGILYGVKLGLLSRELAAQVLELVERVHVDPRMGVYEFGEQIRKLRGAGSQDMRIIRMVEELCRTVIDEVRTGTFLDDNSANTRILLHMCIGGMLGRFVHPVVGQVIASISSSLEG